MRTLVSIQYLRGVAALMVVFYHAFQWTWTPFPTGQAGVDIFFVISGFVMWAITEREPQGPATFLRRRFARIAPPYWIITLAAAALALIWPALFLEIRVTPEHLWKSLLFIPHRDPFGNPFPVLPVGWTLIYEVFFYAVFAFALMFGRALRLAVVTVILCGAALSGFIWLNLYVYGANPMLMEFLAGAWLGRLWSERKLPSAATGSVIVLVGVTALAGLQAIGYETPFWRPLVWGIPAMAIVAGAVSMEADGFMPRLPGLKTLGDCSYSLYLIHPLVNAVVPRLIGITEPQLFIPAVVVLSIALAMLSRRYIEKPMLRLLSPPRRERGEVPAPAAA